MRERIRGSNPSGEERKPGAKTTGTITKQKCRPSGRRPSAALDLINAWECNSSDNDNPDSPKRFRKPDKAASSPKARPLGSAAGFSRWEAEDRESSPIAGPEDQELSEWIADAAMREMMNVRLFSPLFFPDIVVVPKAPPYRNEVKVIEIDDTNEARFSDLEAARVGSPSDNGTPLNSEDRTVGAAGRVRSPVDSGVDVDQSSTLSRGKKCEKRTSQEERMSERECCFEQPCSVDESRRSSDEQHNSEQVRFNDSLGGQPPSSPKSRDISASGQHQESDGEFCLSRPHTFSLKDIPAQWA